jgi:hypothetical protein
LPGKSILLPPRMKWEWIWREKEKKYWKHQRKRKELDQVYWFLLVQKNSVNWFEDCKGAVEDIIHFIWGWMDGKKAGSSSTRQSTYFFLLLLLLFLLLLWGSSVIWRRFRNAIFNWC